MAEQFVAQRQDRQPPAWIDELGMLFWKIGVLVIGLRLVIAVPLPALLQAALTQAVTLLLQVALALVLAGLTRLLWHMLRAGYRAQGRQLAPALRQAWRAWLGSEWLIRLAVDCVLSGLIVLLGVTLAAQERLDWPGVAWLAVIGAIRVVFQGWGARAGASQK